MKGDPRRTRGLAPAIAALAMAAVTATTIVVPAEHVRLALPLGLGKANTVVNALTERALADSSIRLSILTALTLEDEAAGSRLAATLELSYRRRREQGFNFSIGALFLPRLEQGGVDADSGGVSS